MTIIEKFLNKLSLDHRIADGIFDIEKNEHLDIFQETLQKMGVLEEESLDIRNKLSEGKYPDRQAYNANGILVTFPTPEYKQRAISRGTHFEKNPKKKAPNLSFDGKPTSAPAPAAPAAPAPAVPVDPTPTPAPAAPAPAAPAPAAPAVPVDPTPTPAPEPIKTVDAPVLVLPPGEIKKRDDVETKKSEEEYVEKIFKNESWPENV